MDNVQTCDGFASAMVVTVQAMTNGATRTHKLTPCFSVTGWRGSVQGKRVTVTLHENTCYTLHGETYSRISYHPMDVHASVSFARKDQRCPLYRPLMAAFNHLMNGLLPTHTLRKLRYHRTEVLSTQAFAVRYSDTNKTDVCERVQGTRLEKTCLVQAY